MHHSPTKLQRLRQAHQRRDDISYQREIEKAYKTAGRKAAPWDVQLPAKGPEQAETGSKVVPERVAMTPATPQPTAAAVPTQQPVAAKPYVEPPALEACLTDEPMQPDDGDHDQNMGQTRTPPAGRRARLKTGNSTRKSGMKVPGGTSKSPHAQTMRKKAPATPTTAKRGKPAVTRQGVVVDLTSPGDRAQRSRPVTAVQARDLAQGETSGATAAQQTSHRMDECVAEVEAPVGVQVIRRPAWQELRQLWGPAPAYGQGDISSRVEHPHIKQLLSDLAATLSPTPANGNCMCNALIESDINRTLRSLDKTHRPVVARAMQELKLAIFDAYDEDGEREAADMHHDEAIKWMEATGGDTRGGSPQILCSPTRLEL